MRSHLAGTLRAEHAGQTVTLAGWVARRRDHGGVIFIDLRDASGTAQVVFREGEMAERAHRLRSEFCVQVVGEVVIRPEGNENPELPTGAIEVTVTGSPCSRSRRRCRSRSTSTPRSARRSGSSTATSTCAAAGPPPRCGCAAR